MEEGAGEAEVEGVRWAEEGLTEMIDFVEQQPAVDVLISETTTGGFGEVLWQCIVVVTFLHLDLERCRDILHGCVQVDIEIGFEV